MRVAYEEQVVNKDDDHDDEEELAEVEDDEDDEDEEAVMIADEKQTWSIRMRMMMRWMRVRIRGSSDDCL